MALDLIGPYGTIRDVGASEYAINVLLRRGLEVLVCEVGNGAVPHITPANGSMEEHGKDEDEELHVG